MLWHQNMVLQLIFIDYTYKKEVYFSKVDKKQWSGTDTIEFHILLKTPN